MEYPIVFFWFDAGNTILKKNKSNFVKTQKKSTLKLVEKFFIADHNLINNSKKHISSTVGH